MVINKVNQKDETQKKINGQIEKLLDPYRTKGMDASGWDALRNRRK